MKELLLFFGLILALNSYSQDSVKVITEDPYEIFLKNQSQKYLGQPFPGFEIKESSASKFSNADLVNKITFINFWFESCPPCIAEIDGFNQMYEKLKDSSNFLFVTFTFESNATIKEFVSKYNIKYKVIQISKEECYRLNFRNGFPTSFILDKKSLITYFKAGGEIDKVKATNDVLTKIYPSILALL